MSGGDHARRVGCDAVVSAARPRVQRNTSGVAVSTSFYGSRRELRRNTVNDRGTVTVPAAIRRRLDIEAGDELRWGTTDDGELTVEIVRQRYGAFTDDTLKADLGGDSLETHDLAGYESEFVEDA